MGEKVKVLNLIWSMREGGAQQVVLNYLKDFQNDPDIDFRLCVYTAPTKSKYDREIEQNDYAVTYLNGPTTKIQIPYIRRWFHKPVAQKAWEQAIREFRPDIVHVHISELLKFTLEPICRCKVPVRFDTLHSNPYRNTGFTKKTIVRAFHQENVVPICVTGEQVKQAQDWYGIEKWEVIHNGVDIEPTKTQMISRQVAREKFGLTEDEFVVLAVGRFNPIKRFDMLIKAFSILCKKQPNARLVFAGDGEERKKLANLTKKLGMEKNVLFLGNLDNVTEVYCVADVLAVTSKTESSSLVAIEAQVCGLRCVISAGVPYESILLPTSRRLGAEATEEDWAEALLDTTYSGQPVCREEDYEVHAMSQKMKEVYLKYYEEYKRKI